MKTIQYDGFELEHFDSAYNFRKYQLSLIKNYISDKFLEVGPGKGGFAFYYSGLVKKPMLVEPEKKLYKILKMMLKKLKSHQKKSKKINI